MTTESGPPVTTLVRFTTRPPVLATGVAAQLVLFAGLTLGWDLGPAGWIAGLTYTAVGYGLLRVWAAELGPADQVTLARATLTGGVTALVADTLAGSPASPTLLVTVASVALVLDAVDGVVARRTGTSSAQGARFDMEVDAFLILMLSVAVAVQLGPWVLAIGAMRYTFVLAGRLLPWLRAALPASRARKVVAAWQGVTLAAASSEVFPQWFAAAGVGLSLTLLTWSFARDTVRLHGARQQYL